MKTRRSGTMAPLFLALFFIGTVCQAEGINMDKLSEKDEKIIPIAAFTANGDIGKLKIALDEGLDGGLTVNEIKEILIHIHAYAGFPRALNGINTFITVVEDRKARGKTDREGPKATPLSAEYDPNAYGHKVRNTLVGRDISNRRSGYPVFTPIIDTFLVEHLFGDVFARDVLSHQTRELVTISALAAMRGTDPQLKGHLGIAMRMGYSEPQLIHFISVLKDNLGIAAAQRVNLLLGDRLGKPLAPVRSNTITVIKKAAPAKASSDYFTGNATIESRFASGATNNYRGGIVNFETGARTAWHTHPIGQTLIVISGRGMVQAQGEEIHDIRPGDVVWIPGHIRHWHGAAPDSPMSHVAVSEPLNGATVQWMEHVSPDQYPK